MNKEMERELQTLESEKRMDRVALKGHQWSISQQLNGSMGKDMIDVLNGRKKVIMPLFERIKNKIRGLLWNLSLEQ